MSDQRRSSINDSSGGGGGGGGGGRGGRGVRLSWVSAVSSAASEEMSLTESDIFSVASPRRPSASTSTSAAAFSSNAPTYSSSGARGYATMRRQRRGSDPTATTTATTMTTSTTTTPTGDNWNSYSDGWPGVTPGRRGGRHRGGHGHGHGHTRGDGMDEGMNDGTEEGTEEGTRITGVSTEGGASSFGGGTVNMVGRTVTRDNMHRSYGDSFITNFTESGVGFDFSTTKFDSATPSAATSSPTNWIDAYLASAGRGGEQEKGRAKEGDGDNNGDGEGEGEGIGALTEESDNKDTQATTVGDVGGMSSESGIEVVRYDDGLTRRVGSPNHAVPMARSDGDGDGEGDNGDGDSMYADADDGRKSSAWETPDDGSDSNGNGSNSGSDDPRQRHRHRQRQLQRQDEEEVKVEVIGGGGEGGGKKGGWKDDREKIRDLIGNRHRSEHMSSDTDLSELTVHRRGSSAVVVVVPASGNAGRVVRGARSSGPGGGNGRGVGAGRAVGKKGGNEDDGGRYGDFGNSDGDGEGVDDGEGVELKLDIRRTSLFSSSSGEAGERGGGGGHAVRGRMGGSGEQRRRWRRGLERGREVSSSSLASSSSSSFPAMVGTIVTATVGRNSSGNVIPIDGGRSDRRRGGGIAEVNEGQNEGGNNNGTFHSSYTGTTSDSYYDLDTDDNATTSTYSDTSTIQRGNNWAPVEQGGDGSGSVGGREVREGDEKGSREEGATAETFAAALPPRSSSPPPSSSSSSPSSSRPSPPPPRNLGPSSGPPSDPSATFGRTGLSTPSSSSSSSSSLPPETSTSKTAAAAAAATSSSLFPRPFKKSAVTAVAAVARGIVSNRRRSSDDSDIVDPSVLGYGEGGFGGGGGGIRHKRRASFNLKSLAVGRMGDLSGDGVGDVDGDGLGEAVGNAAPHLPPSASSSASLGARTAPAAMMPAALGLRSTNASRGSLVHKRMQAQMGEGGGIRAETGAAGTTAAAASAAVDENLAPSILRGKFAIHRRTNTRGALGAAFTGVGGSIGEGSAGSGSGGPTALRRPLHHHSYSHHHNHRLHSGLIADTEAALARLDNASASVFESVAAAAAVVAASSAAASSRKHRLYGVGDRVLVHLSVLNNTLGDGVAGALAGMAAGGEDAQREADEAIRRLRDSTTLVPVNRHGYPPGGAPPGSAPEAREGPYAYVLATVRKVHFEEDARYYTVLRADTKSEQRADAEWMEKIHDEGGYEAALRAAQTTRASAEGGEADDGAGGDGRKKRTASAVASAAFVVAAKTASSVLCCFCRGGGRGDRGGERRDARLCGESGGPTVGDWCDSARRTLKRTSADFLFGNSPYACRIRITGVNLLVLCSFTFMFLDQMRFAFFAASDDLAIMIVSATVWCILVLELIFEVIIRPSGYSALIESEKAYAPSTARYINGFHLFFEITALALYAPEFRSFLPQHRFGEAFKYSLLDASLKSVLGPTRRDAFVGRLFFMVLRLRIFGLVRHWKKMWINHTFVESQKKSGFLHGFFLPESSLEDESEHPSHRRRILRKKKNYVAAEEAVAEAKMEKRAPMSQEDKRLNKAATIGTALMVVNSHRALLLIVAIIGILPLEYALLAVGGVNLTSPNSVELLQANNLLISNNSASSCAYLQDTVISFIKDNHRVNSNSPFSAVRMEAYLLWALLLPVRCPWQREDGLITVCPEGFDSLICEEWNGATANSTPVFFADKLNLRVGAITTHSFAETGELVNISEVDGFVTIVEKPILFNVTAMYNQGHSVSLANFWSFLLELAMLLLVLVGLTVLRGDAGRLVLDPLRRMLKIVLRYAANPLASTPITGIKDKKLENPDGKDDDNAESNGEKDQLGNYETEQLIGAIAKITDLLRKCWGVAGAGIISANLARTQEGQTVVFNPTVPGKKVYALFAFAGINDFAYLLRSLDQDVMILINDVAKVVHDEVFRWGLGDSGQCNKNLGAAFLMVYRIGDFKEVQEKKARATDVIFSSQEKRSSKKSAAAIRRRHQSGSSAKPRSYQRRARSRISTSEDMDTLQLASLPGIQAFTDRALLGMLKSYAGIHRDKSMLNWRGDFRLGAGVGAFCVDMIFGMDAGWAVEGAVGSEYKIDATYLSPHVNMASRMMSACKQYGVTILLSQAVEELLSDKARAKLRHLDTVTVKGSSLAQRIFTYDARHKGVDFFLWERAPDEADVDSERYSPAIWNTDPDLRGMRQHVSRDFEELFKDGLKQYLAGNWGVAIERLKEANQVMILHGIEEGYIELDTHGVTSQLLNPDPEEQDDVTKVRSEIGDGPCQCLISFMEREGGVAPKDWKHYRPLTNK